LPEPIGTRRADFVVEGKVLVELKAVIQLEDVHWAQVLNYLKAYRLEVGLLINFGSKSMTSPFGHFLTEFANYQGSRYPVRHPS
jgi:GxxExxY protein